MIFFHAARQKSRKNKEYSIFHAISLGKQQQVVFLPTVVSGQSDLLLSA
jgi:hypothetical protein